MYRSINEGVYSIIKSDKKKFGTAYIATSIPIYNDKRILGGLNITQSTKKQEVLEEMTMKLSNSIASLASATEQISAQT